MAWVMTSGGAAVLMAAGLMLAGTAAAQCEFDGSVPGTAAHTYSVSVGGQTFYVDDRDYADADEDGTAGGIWLYYESNGIAGLQRGGSQVVLDKVPVMMPYVGPVTVTLPGAGPVPPHTITLFANGFGGGSVADAAGETDPCLESPTPDTLLA